MLLSTMTARPFNTFGVSGGMDLIKNAGFDAMDMTFTADLIDQRLLTAGENVPVAKEYHKMALDKGLVFNQAHALYPTSKIDQQYTDEVFEKIVASMQSASIMGVKGIVVHPMQHLTYYKNKDQLFEMNVEFYGRLKPYCEEYGIMIYLENMFQRMNGRPINSTCTEPLEFVKYLDALDKNWFAACLDVGHVMITTCDLPEMIKTLGHNRLKALHIHDNDIHNDLHNLPYTGKLIWQELIDGLRQINYSGDFTYEVSSFQLGIPKELYPSTWRYMADVGRYFVSKIQE